MVQVTFINKPVTLVGNEVKVGDKAPDFSVLANDMSTVTLKDSAGKVRLIASVPSLDTGVCDAETRRFNEEVAGLGEDVAFYTVSVDLPLLKNVGVQQQVLMVFTLYQIIVIFLLEKVMGYI